MVQVYMSPEEMLLPQDEASSIVQQPLDTLCVIGKLEEYQSNLQWIVDKVLPVAMKAVPYTKAHDGIDIDDDMDDEPTPAAKKAKTNTAEEEELSIASSLIQKVLSTLHPNTVTAASTELWVPRDPLVLRVILIVLPATVSRHNTPCQSYTIVSTLKRYFRANESTAVVSLCPVEHVFGTVCALARVSTSLLYTRKTTATTTTTTTSTNTDQEEEEAAAAAKEDPSHPKAPLVLSSIDYVNISTSSRRSVVEDLRLLLAPHCSNTKSTITTTTAAANLEHVAVAIQLARRLVDAPANELTTTAFIEQAQALVQSMEHVTMQVISGEELHQKGYGGLYNVGKAAVEPPAMVVLSFVPPQPHCDDDNDDTSSTSSIVLVGKGIVFDTGGLQIKTPKPAMPGMKRDMGGAAAILAAFSAFVRCQNNNDTTSATATTKRRPVHAILCLAENAVAQHALRPDDIITMYSGKTVEINNTDAEGRLVLGDGVCHAAKHLNPGMIIDMATLTGAQGVATGRYFGALYCNDEALEQSVVRLGQSSGDLCHAMPYAPEFFKAEYSSAVADMKNSVADRANAQVSCAGQFIGNHIADWLAVDGNQWCHIDMAYPVFDKKDERATGFGVGLLFSLLEEYSQKK